MNADRTNWRRKGNYAGSVKIILPSGPLTTPCFLLCYSDSSACSGLNLRHNSVDIPTATGIISLTAIPWLAGDAHGRTAGQQGPGLAGARSAPPQAGPGSRSDLPAQRVLRPARPGDGQVRDDPPGAGGAPAGQRGGQGLRLFAGGAVPGDGRLPEGGLAGPAATPAWPKAANKLTDAVLEFIDRQRAADGGLRAPALAKMVQEHLGLSVHPRSIERALARRAKKGRHAEPA
jgi:hypothetical protein